MKVRHSGVPGAAYFPQNLPASNVLSNLDPNAPWSKMKVPGVLPTAQVQGNVVPTNSLHRNRDRGAKCVTPVRDIVRLPIMRRHNSRITNSIEGLLIRIVRMHIVRVARCTFAVLLQHPINREPARVSQMTINHQHSAPVMVLDIVAGTIISHPTSPSHRRSKRSQLAPMSADDCPVS